MFLVDLKRSWLDKAEKASLKALTLDPDLAEAHRSLSRLYWMEGKYSQAIQAAEEAVKANPNYGEAWRLLGQWYTGKAQFTKAENALMKALEVKPTEHNLFSAFMDLYALWGNKKKVEEYFGKGLEVQPTNEAIYSEMSYLLLGWGELKEAKRMAHKAMDINPNGSDALWYLLEIFLISERADSAAYYLNRIRRQNPGQDLFVEMARVALIRGEKKQAEIYLDSCIQFNQPLVKDFADLPEENYARIRMALAWQLKGESKKALEQVDTVRKSLGDSLLTMIWGETAEKISWVYTLAGQKKEAVQLMEFLVENRYYSPEFFKLHPIYRDLTGYPPYETLIKREP